MELEYRTAEESREANVTYHLVPEPIWTARGGEPTYLPDAFDADGFIHCTNGLDPLVAVANMFYQDDRRPHLAIALAMNRITAAVRYDDPEQLYPHIYGPLNTDAVIGALRAIRTEEGAFIDFVRV